MTLKPEHLEELKEEDRQEQIDPESFPNIWEDNGFSNSEDYYRW